MHPCAECRKKSNCPEKCKPKADYIRHMKKLNRRIRKGSKEHDQNQRELDGMRGV